MNQHEGLPAIDLLIPARNEEKPLPILLTEIDRSHLRRILVVDNGSSDRTAELARAAGCEVVSCPEPGYGNACLAGLRVLAADPPHTVVFLDADRSDHPRFLPNLIAPILDGTHDFVLGSRTLGRAETGSLSSVQRFGNWLATTLMRWFWRVEYSDLAPFRAIAWPALVRLNMADKNFGWTIEMQIKAKLAGLRILEVPVDYRNRIGQSKISGTLNGVLRAGSKILYTIFRFKFRPPHLRREPPGTST